MKFPKLKWFSLIAGAVLLLSAGMVVYQLKAGNTLSIPTAADRAAVLNRQAVATQAEPATLVTGNGIVEPFGREGKIAPMSSGVIKRILVREGAAVLAGQLLVELDARLEASAVESAQAEVAAAERDLQKTNAGERPELIDAARRDADAAGERAAQSAAALQRLDTLARQNLVTNDEHDRARHQAAQDRAAYEAAGARRNATANGPRPEDVSIATARIETARARLAEKQAQLSARQIRAPFAGTVLQLKYREGEYVLPGVGDPLLLLGDLSKIRVRADVDERDIARVSLGTPAFVTAVSFPKERFPGRVTEIGKRIGRKNLRTDDPRERIDTKILEVLIELDAATPLLPGQRVTAYLGAKESL